MEICGLGVEPLFEKAGWRCATSISGEQSVMTAGQSPMLKWHADSLDYLLTVIICLCAHYHCCHMIKLYISGASAYSRAIFGRGTGPILLDNVGCNGREARLLDCYHIGVGISDCTHSEDAGIRCTGIHFLGFVYTSIIWFTS